MTRDQAIGKTLREAAQKIAEEMAAKATRLEGEIAALKATLATKRAELVAIGRASEGEVERHAYWRARRGRLYGGVRRS